MSRLATASRGLELGDVLAIISLEIVELQTLDDLHCPLRETVGRRPGALVDAVGTVGRQSGGPLLGMDQSRMWSIAAEAAEAAEDFHGPR